MFLISNGLNLFLKTMWCIKMVLVLFLFSIISAQTIITDYSYRPYGSSDSVSYATNIDTQSVFVAKSSFLGMPDSNYIHIDSTGHLSLLGKAKIWDDLRSPATLTKRGINDKPDFDFTDIGLLFPAGSDTTEKAIVIFQMPHSWDTGTTISPHIHWIQTSSDTIVWKMKYRWYNNNTTPSAFVVDSAVNQVFEYTSGSLLQISSFSDIDGSGIGLSSIFECFIYRDDNNLAQDVLYKEFDIHYQINTLGSNEEFVK